MFWKLPTSYPTESKKTDKRRNNVSIVYLVIIKDEKDQYDIRTARWNGFTKKFYYYHNGFEIKEKIYRWSLPEVSEEMKKKLIEQEKIQKNNIINLTKKTSESIL